MKNLPFVTHHDCTRCSLHEEAKHVGIPMEWVPYSRPISGKWPALIVIGQNPGYVEDREGRNFISTVFSKGQPSAGKTLHEVYLPDVAELATIFTVNAARCGPHSSTNVGPYNACVGYLLHDIQQVALAHPRTALLFVGAPAVKAFTRAVEGKGITQKQSFARQGDTIDIRDLIHKDAYVTMFSTYHPAYVNRPDTQKFIHAVHLHMELVRTWLSTGEKKSVPTAATITATRSPPARHTR